MIFVFIMLEKIFSRSKKCWWKKFGGENLGVQNFFGEKFWWALRAWVRLRENVKQHTFANAETSDISQNLIQTRHPYKIWSESPISPIHLWSYSKSPLQMPLMIFIVIPDMAQFKCATYESPSCEKQYICKCAKAHSKCATCTLILCLQHIHDVLVAHSKCATVETANTSTSGPADLDVISGWL